MHKNVGAAVIGRDKAISAICVEKFDPPTWHVQLIRCQRSAPDPPSIRRGRAFAQRATSARRVMRDGPNFPVLVVHRVVPAKLATRKFDGFVLSGKRSHRLAAARPHGAPSSCE